MKRKEERECGKEVGLCGGIEFMAVAEAREKHWGAPFL